MTTPNSSRLSWARLLAEAVAIVVSILIAFGLDAWWDESREAAEERRHLVATEPVNDNGTLYGIN